MRQAICCSSRVHIMHHHCAPAVQERRCTVRKCYFSGGCSLLTATAHLLTLRYTF